jgi:hypothetical protein
MMIGAVNQRAGDTGLPHLADRYFLGAVCTENLNPEVVVMESAEDGARLYASGPLNRANSRRVFVQ